MFDAVAANKRHVEARVRAVPLLMVGQCAFGGKKQPGLLARQKRSSRLYEVSPCLDLHEDECRVICHDQIYFASFGTQPPCKHIETMRVPMISDAHFRPTTVQFGRTAPVRIVS